MTWFNVKFIFDNDHTQHLSYYVEALDIIEAENKAFEKLGENGKKQGQVNLFRIRFQIAQYTQQRFHEYLELKS